MYSARAWSRSVESEVARVAPVEYFPEPYDRPDHGARGPSSTSPVRRRGTHLAGEAAEAALMLIAASGQQRDDTWSRLVGRGVATLRDRVCLGEQWHKGRERRSRQV